MNSINDATRFILPMLYKEVYESNKIFQYNDVFFINDFFVNCFIEDKTYKCHMDYPILLMYNINKSYWFDYLEDYIYKHDFYVDDYTIDNKVVYCFKIPKEYLVDYLLLKNGWYSKITEKQKDNILSFWRLKSGEDNLIKSILYKTKLIDDYIIKNNLLTKLENNRNIGEKWYKFDKKKCVLR